MAVGTTVSGSFGELDNIRNLEIAELHPADGIAEALFTIAQIGFMIGVSGTAPAQDIHNTGLVIDTGGDIGTVPYAVLFSIGKVIFVNCQGAGAGGVDGGIPNGCGRYANGAGQAQHQCQAKRNRLC